MRINAEGGYSRRRALWLEMPPGATALLKRFVEARLLVTDRDPQGRETIEVAHEALLRTWPLLGGWLAEDRDRLRLLESIQRAAEDWDKNARRADLLIHRDGRLKEAEALLATPRFVVPATSIERAYLEACSAAQHARETDEKAAQEQRIRDAERIAEEQKRAAVAQRRTVRITRVALVVALLVATLTSWLYATGLTLRHGTAMVLAAVGLYPVLYRIEPEMIAIPAGTFSMGSMQGPDEPYATLAEMPQHEVRIAAFALGKYEITFNEYDHFAYATGRPLPQDQGWGRGRHPVINVSWKEAVEYVKWLSRLTGKAYRLPSEAEWEYAARAHNTLLGFKDTDPNACQYANGADFSFQGEISGKDKTAEVRFQCDDHHSETAEVGSFRPNDFGLYDMLGNVWEWVQDTWHDNYDGAPVEGSAWEDNGSDRRVIRGGAWDSGPGEMRVAARANRFFYRDGSKLGFRVARTLGE